MGETAAPATPAARVRRGALAGAVASALVQMPLDALGGALIVSGWQLVDDWSRRMPRQLLRRGSGDATDAINASDASDGRALDARQRRTLRENYAVMLLVADTLVFVGLAEGIVVGVIAAMVLFVRSNSRALVRSVARGNVRRSGKVHGPQAVAMRDAHGARIALLELEGRVFFGTADELADRVRQLAPDTDSVILGLRRVSDIDSTGARTVLDLAGDLTQAGKQLIAADLGTTDARLQTIRAMGGSTPGEVAIMLPGRSGRRLAALAPGIVFGELALLHHTQRSADAVAASPLTLRLDTATFDRLREERPALWDRLMRNLTLHLSARLRSVTVELSAALAP